MPGTGILNSDTDGSWQLLFAAGFYPAENYFHSCFFSFSNNTLVLPVHSDAAEVGKSVNAQGV